MVWKRIYKSKKHNTAVLAVVSYPIRVFFGWAALFCSASFQRRMGHQDTRNKNRGTWHTQVQHTKGVKESPGYQCVFDKRRMILVTYEKSENTKTWNAQKRNTQIHVTACLACFKPFGILDLPRFMFAGICLLQRLKASTIAVKKHLCKNDLLMLPWMSKWRFQRREIKPRFSITE